MEKASKKLGKKLGNKTEMKWQWVKNDKNTLLRVISVNMINNFFCIINKKN